MLETIGIAEEKTKGINRFTKRPVGKACYRTYLPKQHNISLLLVTYYIPGMKNNTIQSRGILILSLLSDQDEMKYCLDRRYNRKAAGFFVLFQFVRCS